MRRLHIYLLVDNCQSMSGKPILMVEECINNAIISSKYDPNLLETGLITIISFGNNKVTVIESCKPVNEMGKIKFNCSGYSNINYGLESIENHYKENFIPTTVDKKGDWKPILFYFSGLALNTKIDNALLFFLNKHFGYGFSNYNESFNSERIKHSNNNIFNAAIIVTSQNEYTINSFKNYFTIISTYEKPEQFNNFYSSFFKIVS